MARRGSPLYDVDLDRCDLCDVLSSDVRNLAAQVNNLQIKVTQLQSSLSQSLELQHSLLDHLENQTNPNPQVADSQYEPTFHASTPAPRFSNPSRYSEGASVNSSWNSAALQSRLLPDKFDGGVAMQPDDWLQTVALYKEAGGLSDAQLFLEMPRFLAKEPKKWFSAMQPHLSSWAQFSDLFRQAFLPSDNQEKIWRCILDRVQRPDEPLPTFVTHLVGEFKRLKMPPSVPEQIEIIRRHVSDQYRLALYSSSLGSITDLLLKAHELHSALGPVSSERSEPGPRAQSRQKLHCFKCMAPGVTVRNCMNCSYDRDGARAESSREPPTVHESEVGSTSKVGEVRTSPQMGRGARSREFRRGGRDSARGSNSGNSRNYSGNSGNYSGNSGNFSGAGPSVSLIQHKAGRLGQPIKTDVLVEGTPLVAIMDSGATISAVHPSTLEECGISEDMVSPWVFNPVELAVSERCLPSGLVWLQIQLLGRLFSHRLAVIPELSCPILLGTDFMIPADVHMHPAAGRVWLGENSASAPELSDEELRDLDGHIAFLGHDELRVSIHDKVRDAALPEREKAELAQSLEVFSHLFNGRLGRTSLVEHSVETGTAKPVCLPPYRTSPEKRKLIGEQVSKMLADGIIEPANGPWASPVVIVDRRTAESSEPRFCVDYRKVNKTTVKDSYPLPRVDESLDFLARGRYISTLDLARGYWQVAVAPESRPKTAFVCHMGLYQFRVMPFGLSNAPATFQRLMNSVLAGLTYKCCVVYLDDIVVASPTFSQHLDDLDEVFTRLADAGLSLKISKCHFCKASLRYLGYIVTQEGLSPDEDKVNAIKDFPRPRSVKQVKQFLGMSGYYRRFIQGYSTVAEPLIALTRDGTPFVWSDDCRQALDSLKSRLCTAPVLVLPDFGKPFAVHTDACDVGLGAALVQTDERGHERAIAYASRTLSKSERPYSTSEKECLGVIWALEHFRPYIEGTHVTVVTDHNSLRWLMSRPTPSGRLARWCLRLQDFDLEIVHKPGAANSVPDALSRNPVSPGEVIGLLPEFATVGLLSLRNQPLLVLDDKVQLRALQDADSTIGSLRSTLESASCVDSSDFCLHDGLVYFRDKRASCRLHPYRDLRLYVPTSLRSTLLEYFHDHPMAGHLGIAKTQGRLQQRVYWPGMRGDVKRYVLSCSNCQFSKPTNRKPGGFLQPVVASFPWEFAGVDFVGPLPRSSRGNAYILVFVDYFTKWVEICPVREATAHIAAEKFLSEVFARHGAPRHLVSDRGVQFVSDVFESVVREMGTVHRLTTAYHPQSNQTERVNRTIKTAIRAYVGSRHREWDRHLSLISFALRTAPHQSTGDSPAFLLYGRDLATPLDLWMQPELGPPPEDAEAYKSELSATLRDAYDHVRQSLAASHETQKCHYDKKRRQVVFKVGDLVRLRAHPRSNASVGFAAKLAPLFKGPYRVERVMSDLNCRLSRVSDGSDAGVHHVANMLPFFTWGEDARSQQGPPDQPVGSVLDAATGADVDEAEDYGFDFLFADVEAAGPPVVESEESLTVLPSVLEVSPLGVVSGERGSPASLSLPRSSPSLHHASRYSFRPRHAPRVSSVWATTRWSHPYFAEKLDL